MKSSRVLKSLACAMLVMSLMVQTATALTTSYHVFVARTAVAYGLGAVDIVGQTA